MATFSYTPDRPVSESSTPRLTEVRFRNYEQRDIFGINPFRDKWSLSFTNRSLADIGGIVDFLKARDGSESFEWVTPFNETAQFICTDWDVTLESCNYRSVKAEFELCYEPDATNLAVPAGTATTFTWIPDFTADFGYKSNTKTFAFGDNYTGRIKFGINQQTETWSLEFRNRDNTERNQIRTFLRQARGVAAFSWTDPLTSASGKYVCVEWNIQYNNYNNNDIQASFKRVFEP